MSVELSVDDPSFLVQLFPSLRLSAANDKSGQRVLIDESDLDDNPNSVADEVLDEDDDTERDDSKSSHPSKSAPSATTSSRPRRKSSSSDEDKYSLPEDWSDWSDAVERGKVDKPEEAPRSILPAFKSTLHPELVFRVAVQQVQGIGFQLWPAAVVMCRWFETQTSYPKDFLRGKRVLELGAGCGLVGMLVASDIIQAAHVCITDLPQVVPHIQANIDANLGSHLQSDRISAAALEFSIMLAAWGCEDEWKDQFPAGSYDVIMLSDCLYHEHLFQPLMDTLLQLCTPDTLVLMCQKHRWMHSERRFFRRLGKYFNTKTVGELKFLPHQRRFEHIFEITRKPKK